MANFLLFRELDIIFPVESFLSPNMAENVCLFPVLDNHFFFLKGSKLRLLNWSVVSIGLTSLCLL